MASDSAALQHAVAAAAKLGAEFRVLGTEIVIKLPDGDIVLPLELQSTPAQDTLYDYFGAAAEDALAVEFLAKLGIDAVLVTDRAGCDAAIADLAALDHELIGIDIETAAGLPPSIPINKDGSVAKVRRRRDDPVPAATDPLRAEIASVQLYRGGKEAYVFTGEAKARLLESAWLPLQHFVAHNAAFELGFLQHIGIAPGQPFECTMQMAGLVYGPGARSLAGAAERVLGEAPPKTLGTSYWGAATLSKGQVAYAASDAIMTWLIGSYLLPRIACSRYQTAYELQRDVLPAVAAMRHRGLGFDATAHAVQIAEWGEQQDTLCNKYFDLTGNSPPRTPAEIGKLIPSLTGHWSLPWPRTATGKLSTTRAHLKQLDDKPEIALLLEILARKKLITSQFGAKLGSFIHPVTGRLHADYVVGGAVTGRFSAKQPNLQQLPRSRAPDYRRVITAAVGNVLVVGDFDQIELCAFAWLSGNTAMTAAYAARPKRDLHRETAAAITGVPYDAITKAQRDHAKPVNFGAIYGIGPETLAADARDNYGIAMTVEEAAEYLRRFFERYPAKPWMTAHAETCQQRGFVEIVSGRIVAECWLRNGERLNFNRCCCFPVQGAAADAILRAIIFIEELFPGVLVAIVHDELILEVRVRDAVTAARLLDEAMTAAFVATFPGAPSHEVVEIGIGANWCEAKQSATILQPARPLIRRPGSANSDDCSTAAAGGRRGSAAA